MWYSVIDLKPIVDERGNLVVLEQNKEIPFAVKRVYYLFGVKTDLERGAHAHKALEQVIICLNGSCEVDLYNGKEKATIILDHPTKALHIKPITWRTIRRFSSKHCVVLTLASDYYKESDYIRNYQDFKEFSNT